MATEDNKALAKRWLEEVWNQGDLSLVDELIAANYVLLTLTEVNEPPMYHPPLPSETAARTSPPMPPILPAIIPPHCPGVFWTERRENGWKCRQRGRTAHVCPSAA